MPPAVPDDHAFAIHLDKLLADQGMTLTELFERVGVSMVNLSILKNGHARAIRFSTLRRQRGRPQPHEPVDDLREVAGLKRPYQCAFVEAVVPDHRGQ